MTVATPAGIQRAAGGGKWTVGVQSLPRDARTPLNVTTYLDLGIAIGAFMDEVKKSLKFLGVTEPDNTSLGDLYREFVTDEEESWDAFYNYLTGDFGVREPANVVKAVVETDCYMWMHSLAWAGES